MRRLRSRKVDALSFAVFAFAVEDMKALERVITSASPFAFLVLQVIGMDKLVRPIQTFGPDTVLLV